MLSGRTRRAGQITKSACGGGFELLRKLFKGLAKGDEKTSPNAAPNTARNAVRRSIDHGRSTFPERISIEARTREKALPARHEKGAENGVGRLRRAPEDGVPRRVRADPGEGKCLKKCIASLPVAHPPTSFEPGADMRKKTISRDGCDLCGRTEMPRDSIVFGSLSRRFGDAVRKVERATGTPLGVSINPWKTRRFSEVSENLFQPLSCRDRGLEVGRADFSTTAASPIAAGKRCFVLGVCVVCSPSDPVSCRVAGACSESEKGGVARRKRA